MNIPNFISLARLFSVPVLVWAISEGRMMLAFWLFVAAGISDAVDGFIAKRFNFATKLGSFLDPLADKALLVSMYIVLGLENHLPTWLVILVVWRDLLIIGGAMLYHTLTQRLTMEPLLVSKVNTLAQIILAGYVLATRALGVADIWVFKALVGLVALTTVVSGASYVVRWIQKAGSMEKPR
ncbi:MAG: CDP-alcohol phosphatidyltransferase family protein [Alphaproteobacteria bacterium]